LLYPAGCFGFHDVLSFGGVIGWGLLLWGLTSRDLSLVFFCFCFYLLLWVLLLAGLFSGFDTLVKSDCPVLILWSKA